MDAKIDGSTALFAAGCTAFPYVGELPEGGTLSCPGMTLRDWFAGQALAGDLAATQHCRPSAAGMAQRAYAQADAMLAERVR